MRAVEKFDFEATMLAISDLQKGGWKDQRDAVLMAIGTLTALRISDYIGLRWEDLYKHGSIVEELHILEAKTGKYRRVTIGQRLHGILSRAYKSMKPEIWHHVFRRHAGGQRFGHVTRIGANYIIKSVADKYNLGEGSSHSLRKTGAYQIYKNNGKDHMALMITSKALNHSGTLVTMTYLGITKDAVTKSYMNL